MVLVSWGKIGDPHLILGKILVAQWCYRKVEHVEVVVRFSSWDSHCSWLSCSLGKIGHQKKVWLVCWNTACGELKNSYSFNM